MTEGVRAALSGAHFLQLLLFRMKLLCFFAAKFITIGILLLRKAEGLDPLKP